MIFPYLLLFLEFRGVSIFSLVSQKDGSLRLLQNVRKSSDLLGTKRTEMWVPSESNKAQHHGISMNAALRSMQTEQNISQLNSISPPVLAFCELQLPQESIVVGTESVKKYQTVSFSYFLSMKSTGWKHIGHFLLFSAVVLLFSVFGHAVVVPFVQSSLVQK